MWTYNDIISITSNTEKRKISEDEISNIHNKKSKFEYENNKENENLTNLNGRKEETVLQQNKTEGKLYPTQTKNEKSKNVAISTIEQNLEENNSEEDDPEMVEILVNFYKKHNEQNNYKYILWNTLKDDNVYLEIEKLALSGQGQEKQDLYATEDLKTLSFN